MKRNADEVLDSLRDQVAFLAEAGAGFCLKTPARVPAPPETGREMAQFHSPLPDKLDSTEGERTALEDIDRQVLACVRCPLHRLRSHAVPGEGNPGADLMFVGEAPGRDEDAQGRPFVGRAGQLLRRIIAAMKFREDEVYITNVVKCRPPENRVPHREEVEACTPYLLRQIELIRPRVIVTLGRTPTEYFLPGLGRQAMTDIRGNFFDSRGVPVMPTFHPSYLVRNEGNRELKRMVWEDMRKVMALLGRK